MLEGAKSKGDREPEGPDKTAIPPKLTQGKTSEVTVWFALIA